MSDDTLRETMSVIGRRRRVAASAATSRLKRVLDVALAGIGLVLVSPMVAAIAALIRLDSPGPAFFRQTRIGLGGVPFRMFKFRTMSVDCDAAAHREYVTRLIRSASEALRGDAGLYKLENDARITRVGRYLRRFSLDELPQLLNVLAGDMSLVGPRPPLAYEVELYTAAQRRRLTVPPGMTGLWQVSGRNETTYEEMVDLDLAYVDRWSFGLDLTILMRTASVVLTGRGAS